MGPDTSLGLVYCTLIRAKVSGSNTLIRCRAHRYNTSILIHAYIILFPIKVYQ